MRTCVVSIDWSKIAGMGDALRDRIAALPATRDGAIRALERAKSRVRQATQLTPTLIEQFGRVMRENPTTGEIPFRKAYLDSIVDRIEVDDREVRILGRKGILEQCVMSNGALNAEVRRSVPSWLRG